MFNKADKIGNYLANKFHFVKGKVAKARKIFKLVNLAFFTNVKLVLKTFMVNPMNLDEDIDER